MYLRWRDTISVSTTFSRFGLAISELRIEGQVRSAPTGVPSRWIIYVGRNMDRILLLSIWYKTTTWYGVSGKSRQEGRAGAVLCAACERRRGMLVPALLRGESARRTIPVTCKDASLLDNCDSHKIEVFDRLHIQIYDAHSSTR